MVYGQFQAADCAILVLCPDPTQFTQGEGVWCHKFKSLALQKYRSLVFVSVGLKIGQCWIMNFITSLWSNMFEVLVFSSVLVQ